MASKKFHIVLLIHSILGWVPLVAQGPSDAELLSAPVYREHFYLHTDKNFYGAGEPVLFRAFNQSPLVLRENDWSTVLYLELVSSSHVPVAQGKFPLEKEGSWGTLEIPDTVSTGTYQLRAYTRWMRNFPATEYATVPVLVINAEKPGLLEETGDGAEASMEPTAEVDQVKATLTPSGSLQCVPDRSLYSKREKVVLRIRTGEQGMATEGVAISVAKKDFLIDREPRDPTKMGVTGKQSGTVSFPPETRGITMEGKIVRGEEQQPAAFARMHLTLLGPEPDYFGIVSDEEGNIRFAIPPHAGASNALISFDEKGNRPYELLLDDAFSKEYPEDSAPLFRDLQVPREVLEEVLMLTQLRTLFGTSSPAEPGSVDTAAPVYFYGTADYWYSTADYISLPNLQEFFFELIPQVSVRRSRGEYQLAIMDDAEFALDYAPLILLDHVAIQDLDALLHIDLQSIKYVDIVNTNYIRGGNIYGGIISIISKAGNLAGVSLPAGSTIIDLQTYQGSGKEGPLTFSIPSEAERIPDLRTLLYWDPHRQIPAGDEILVEFQTSDVPGTYLIQVMGTDSMGRMMRNSCEFTVK